MLAKHHLSPQFPKHCAILEFIPLSLFSKPAQSQHHDDEKRALSREIIVLNNHLMEAKLTIEKLQEDNVRIAFSVLPFLRIKSQSKESARKTHNDASDFASLRTA